MLANVATGQFDPELLQARLDSVQDEQARLWATRVAEGALKCLVRVQEINLSELERTVDGKTPHELWGMANDPVAKVWLELEELRSIMKPLVDAYEAQSDDGLEGLDDLGGEPTQPAGDVTTAQSEVKDESSVVLEGLTLRVAETAWSMSFVLHGEVDGFRRRLDYVLNLPDGWELLGAVQDHIGHLRSAVSALLTGVFSSLPSLGEQVGSDQSFELMSSRELRARVFELRDAILEVENELRHRPVPEWLDSLKRASTLVEQFTFGPGFAWMRATDKRTFLNGRQTLSEILELWNPLRAQPAQRAIDNMARFLEAMEVINQRECLTVHDRNALRTVVQKMEMASSSEGQQAREAIAAGLAALSETQGRDRVLDALLAQTLAPGTPVPVDKITMRAKEILSHLGG